MKVLNANQMKEIDRLTIEEIGLLGPVLMENAGRQIFLSLARKFPDFNKQKFVIICGKGNNGGDGLVVARHLFNHGCQPRIFLLALKEEVKGDAALNLRIADNIGLTIEVVNEEKDWISLSQALSEATIIIDAIFGTGLEKPAEGKYARAIEMINKSRAFKIAVDIPSGLSSDTPQLIGPAVKADLTVTLGAPKIAHVLPPAEEFAGEVVVADISLPRFLFTNEKHKVEWLSKDKIVGFFQPRKRDTHKGTYGHLLILAGSLGKTGAAIMAARAALKSGAGLVTVATPKSCLPIIARSTMEVMTEPLPETKEGTVSPQALTRLRELIKGKDALLIGPGLSTHPQTAELISFWLPEIKLPCLIDADGLNILARFPELLKEHPPTCVLTPHPGEFSRLIDISISEVLARRLQLAQDFSQRYGLFLILKGHRTIISNPEGFVYINPTGNPGMASGGSGDVLSGLAASFLMQFKDPFLAAAAATYVHGLSGDMARKKVGERPLVAGDLLRFLPQAIKKLEDLAKEEPRPKDFGFGLIYLSQL